MVYIKKQIFKNNTARLNEGDIRLCLDVLCLIFVFFQRCDRLHFSHSDVYKHDILTTKGILYIININNRRRPLI